MAATVKFTDPKASTLPKFPAAVVHVGASETVSKAVPVLAA